MPFLIEDLTPRDRRVPGGPATDHPNGAAGIERLEISVADADRVAERLAALTQTPPDSLRLGTCGLVLEERDRETHGPSAVHLSTDAPENVGERDRGLARGVRFVFARETRR